VIVLVDLIALHAVVVPHLHVVEITLHVEMIDATEIVIGTMIDVTELEVVVQMIVIKNEIVKETVTETETVIAIENETVT
jgi:hypothetical protein